MTLEIPEELFQKIGNGTQNMAKVPTMTRNQAIQSLQTEFNLAFEWSSKGTDVFAAGEMGIGNSTSAAAIMATFDGGPIELSTGSGTGVDKDGLKKKIKVIRKALQVNKPDPKDPLDVLTKIGGFEIGGMAGLILGTAERQKDII
jgi:nicotinate-nucleotide--dimethylbenzimidazole phosphoribosyltransferase